MKDVRTCPHILCEYRLRCLDPHNCNAQDVPTIHVPEDIKDYVPLENNSPQPWEFVVKPIHLFLISASAMLWCLIVWLVRHI